VSELKKLRDHAAPPLAAVKTIPAVVALIERSWLGDPAAAPPPAPPLPPLPPSPPSPPSPLPPLPPTPNDVYALGFFDRIALVDAQKNYLAGRQLDLNASLQRPIIDGGKVIAYFVVARSDGPNDAFAKAFITDQRRSLIVIAALSILLSGLAATVLAAHFRKPIRKLAQGTRLLATGRFDTRLDLVRSDELGELARNFNQLADELQRKERSRRQWVTDTSHELRTPLSVLRAQLEAVQDGVRTASPNDIAAMLGQVLALNRLIDELYQLACADVGQLDYHKRSIDPWNILHEQVIGFQKKLQSAGLQLELCDAPAAASVTADPDRLRQLISNLLENSVRYTASGGRVVVRTDTVSDKWRLVIEDSAPAVPDAALSRLSERWYRVEASRSRIHGGAGLGLALSQTIVQAHGGRLQFSHSALGGLRVDVTLPLEQ
jgi:two-component system, OmpR family, sensor histidine kinase BaeS